MVLGVPAHICAVGLYFRGSCRRFARRPPPKTKPRFAGLVPKGSLSLTQRSDLSRFAPGGISCLLCYKQPVSLFLVNIGPEKDGFGHKELLINKNQLFIKNEFSHFKHNFCRKHQYKLICFGNFFHIVIFLHIERGT